MIKYMNMRLPKLQTCFNLAAVVLLCLIVRLLWITRCSDLSIFGDGSGRHRGSGGNSVPVMVKRDGLVVKDEQSGRVFSYHKEMPLVFIGGVPRSGTTLMRAMLDAHPDIRCGEETRVIPNLLSTRKRWKSSDIESRRLMEAGVTDEVLDSAISSFILDIIVKHGQPAPRLCNKDPLTMKSTEYLSQQFPNAKFIMMIRDGRASVHSMITRRVGVGGFNMSDPRQSLEMWNETISQMYHQCSLVGDARCFPMYYEQLVLHPEKHMKDLLQFLDLPWNSSVLHHEMFIGKEISLSKTERSTDQVVKPVNTDALTSWVGFFSEEIVRDMAKIAPMLALLGYDPDANPPDYGKADDFVRRNTDDVHKNRNYWDQKVAEVLNSTGKPTPANKDKEAPTAYYGGIANVGTRALPRVSKPQSTPKLDEGEENAGSDKNVKDIGAKEEQQEQSKTNQRSPPTWNL